MTENGLDINQLLAVAQSKLNLPLLFVKCKPNSEIKISQDDSKKHLKLEANQKFSLTDEHHLFQCMNLTSTNEYELASMLPREVFTYLKHHKLIAPPKPRSEVKPVTVERVEPQGTPMTKLLPHTHSQVEKYREPPSQEGLTQTDCVNVSTNNDEHHLSPHEQLQIMSPRKS